MSEQRRVLLRVALAGLSVLPLPALGQGLVGPPQRIRTFEGFRGAGVTSSARAGSLAFFTVKGPYTFQSFWRSDGTPAGTFQIGPRTPPPQTTLRFWSSHGDLALFTWALDATPEERNLWRSDGSDAGTFPITQGLSLAADTGGGAPPANLSVPETGLAFFSAGPRSGSPDFELWATDGTAAGTRLVEDVNPEGASNPSFLTDFQGQLFFLAGTPEGRELWRSDGTAEGTERVADFHESGDKIVAVLQAGGALFVLLNKDPGVEVWRSDGTETGTTRVLDLPAMALQRSVVAGTHLFLIAGGSPSPELWAVDRDTGEAVRLVTTGVDELSAVGDHAFFDLSDDHGVEPWWSDGTPEGTHRIADICPGTCGSFPRFLGTYRGRAVLAAHDSAASRETPWLTDGTADGTYPLGDVCPDEGQCISDLIRAVDLNGWLLLFDFDTAWVSDGSRDSLWATGILQGPLDWIELPEVLLVPTLEPLIVGGVGGSLWSIPVTAPLAPQGDWLASDRVPGFFFKARIAGTIQGRQEPACIAETLCVSGALPGRSEAFLRVVGPKPNGRLWPTLVKFSTSLVEVWVRQAATGQLRSYRLEAADPFGSILPGVLDREGFPPVGPGGPALAEEPAAGAPPPPAGGWIVSRSVPGFRFKARITSGGATRTVRNEPCIAETLCLSGAVRGRPELFVRIVGPKPNGSLWPSLVRFTTSAVEVWIEQVKTGTVRYYQLEELPQGSSQLNGLFDKSGFRP